MLFDKTLKEILGKYIKDKKQRKDCCKEIINWTRSIIQIALGSEEGEER